MPTPTWDKDVDTAPTNDAPAANDPTMTKGISILTPSLA